MHNRLKTRAELFRKHSIDDCACMRCGFHVEDTLHAVKDYIDSKCVWLALIPNHLHFTFFMLDFRS